MSAYRENGRLIVEQSDMLRFRSKYVVRPDGCWEWTAGHVPLGYGNFFLKIDGKKTQFRAHRFAYIVLVGPIDKGLELDHLCGHPYCVNPAHLEPVTHAENLRRGQAPNMVCHRAGTCRKGHPVVGDNALPMTRSGGRKHMICRICQEARIRARPEKRRLLQEASRNGSLPH